MNAVERSAPAERDSTLTHLLSSLLYTIATVVLLGIVYPVIITICAQLLSPMQAGGSLIRDARGTVVGSALAGQLFTKPQYFHGRPSAAGNGYDPLQSGGTNLGPTSKKLIAATRAAQAHVMAENDGIMEPPADLVTSSGSGLDPDISPAAAAYQAVRVARVRHMPVSAVRALIARYTLYRTLGVFGEPRVNVLALNLALDNGRR